MTTATVFLVRDQGGSEQFFASRAEALRFRDELRSSDIDARAYSLEVPLTEEGIAKALNDQLHQWSVDQ